MRNALFTLGFPTASPALLALAKQTEFDPLLEMPDHAPVMF